MTDQVYIFLGDAPGQSECIRIGGCTYRRGQEYTGVPRGVLARGGWLVRGANLDVEDGLAEVDGVVLDAVEVAARVRRNDPPHH